MPKYEREDALCKLSDFFVDGMDLDSLRQMAFENIWNSLQQESDVELKNKLIEHNLYEEIENA